MKKNQYPPKGNRSSRSAGERNEAMMVIFGSKVSKDAEHFLSGAGSAMHIVRHVYPQEKNFWKFFHHETVSRIRAKVLKLTAESKIVSIVTDGSHMVHHAINKSFLRKLGLKHVPVISSFASPEVFA